MYHYPYVYYPQNFWGPDYYRSSGNMYYRYPPEMQTPVYNRQWHNEFPQEGGITAVTTSIWTCSNLSDCRQQPDFGCPKDPSRRFARGWISSEKI